MSSQQALLSPSEELQIAKQHENYWYNRFFALQIEKLGWKARRPDPLAKEERKISRERERSELFKEECRELVTQFAYSIWERAPSRMFSLHYVFAESKYSLRWSLTNKSGNEIEVRIPVFHDAVNPGRWNIWRMHFLIVDRIDQKTAAAWVDRKRKESGGITGLDYHRTMATSYVVLSRVSRDGYAEGGKKSQVEFLFVRPNRDPKFQLSLFFKFCRSLALKWFDTAFRFRDLKHSMLRNLAHLPSWFDGESADVGLWHRPSITSKFGTSCEFNNSLLTFSGRPMNLSESSKKALRCLTRLVWEFDIRMNPPREERGSAQDVLCQKSSEVRDIVHIEPTRVSTAASGKDPGG